MSWTYEQVHDYVKWVQVCTEQYKGASYEHKYIVLFTEMSIHTNTMGEY